MVNFDPAVYRLLGGLGAILTPHLVRLRMHTFPKPRKEVDGHNGTDTMA